MRTSELNHFRKRLTTMKLELREQLDAFDTENERHLANEGGVAADRDFEGYEQDVIVANSERTLLGEITAALHRIEIGGYGKCDECGANVAPERLEAIPYARHCTGCAEKLCI